MGITEPLIDTFGRVHTNLRISVTDRCNIRCFYCMPETVRFLPQAEILTYEEIERLVRVVAQMGVDRLRITGGEPLVRTQLPRLIEILAAVPGIRDIALTTNGILLADQAQALLDADLSRLNISLDGLNEETFRKISRRGGLDRVLEGIFAARRAGFEKIRLNAVAIRGITEAEVVPLGHFARKHRLEMRFIEFMPLDAESNWQTEQVLAGKEIREILEAEFGPLIPLAAMSQARRPWTTSLPTASAAWVSSILSRSRSAGTAIGCGLPPRGRFAIVCSQRKSGTCASYYAVAARTIKSPKPCDERFTRRNPATALIPPSSSSPNGRCIKLAANGNANRD